jgi:hypothetical protein
MNKRLSFCESACGGHFNLRSAGHEFEASVLRAAAPVKILCYTDIASCDVPHLIDFHSKGA